MGLTVVLVLLTTCTSDEGRAPRHRRRRQHRSPAGRALGAGVFVGGRRVVRGQDQRRDVLLHLPPVERARSAKQTSLIWNLFSLVIRREGHGTPGLPATGWASWPPSWPIHGEVVQADQHLQRLTATTITGPCGGRSRYCWYLSASRLTALSRTAPSSMTSAVPSPRTHHKRDQSSS